MRLKFNIKVGVWGVRNESECHCACSTMDERERGASSAEPRERRHGDVAQDGPAAAVAVAVAWFTLCWGGVDVNVWR